MSDVLFTGDFDLDIALQKFSSFANQIQQRLSAISSQASKGGSAKEVTQELDAETKRQQKITDQHIAHNISKAKEQTKAEINEGKIRTKEEEAERKRQQKITNEHLAYNVRFAKQQTKINADRLKQQTAEEERALGESRSRYQEFFAAFTVGGFALQRFGQFLTQNVSRPLIDTVKNIYTTTLAVNDFEETLRVRGSKSKAEIEEIYKVVKNVSNLPNLERSDVLTIFSRILEVTQGGITAKELEKIGGGLSKITTSLEAGEKRAFYGQLQDILGGGNVSNLEKTLSLVPLLKSKYDELKLAATIGKTSTESRTLVLQALSDLSILPNVDTIATAVKRLRNEVFEFSRRIGNIYKDDLRVLINYILNTVIPTIDALITRFEHAGQAIHVIVAAIVALGIALPPIISAVGAFAIAIGGIGFAFETLTKANLSLGAIFGGTGTVFQNVVAFATKLPEILRSIISPLTIVIALLTAGLAKAFSTNAGGIQDALASLAASILPAIGTALLGIYNTLTGIGTIIANVYNIIDVGGIITEVLGTAATILANILQFLIQISAATIGSIGALFQFLGDFLGGNFDLAMARFELSILKTIKSITLLSELFSNVFGIDLDKAISAREADVARLERGIGKLENTAQTEADKTKEKQTALNAAYKETQKTIGEITDAIKAQTKALEENIVKQRQAQQEFLRGLKAANSEADTAAAESNLADIDLTTPEGRARAEEEFKKISSGLSATAIIQANTRIQKNLQAVLVEQSKAALTLADKEIRQDVKKFYEDYARVLNTAVSEGFELTPNYLASLHSYLAKGPGAKLSSGEVAVVIKQLQVDYDSFVAASKAENKNLDEEIKATNVIAQKRGALDKQLREAQRDQNNYQLSILPKARLDQVDGEIARLQDRRQKLIGLGKEVIYLTQWYDALRENQDELIQAVQKQANIQLELERLETKTNLDHQKAQDEIVRQKDNRIQEIKDETHNTQESFIVSTVKDEIQQREELTDLLEVLQQRLFNENDLLIELEANGATTDGKIVDIINSRLDLIFKLGTEGQLEKVKNLANILEKDQFANLDADSILKPLQKAMASIREMGQGDLLDPQKRRDIIENAKTYAILLQTYIAGLPSGSHDAAQAQIFLTSYIEFIKAVEKGQETLNKKINPELRSLEVQQRVKDNEIKITQTIADQLELEQQILDIRQKRLEDSSAPVISKIYAAITGAQKKIDDARIEALENQKKLAQLELEGTLLRLEAEHLITIERLRQGGASEKEIQKLDELYNKQIENLKIKGELQGILIDEQIKGAHDNSSGGGLLGAIIESVGGLFKKKKPAVTVSGTSVNGQIVVDPNAINSGQIPDTSGLPPVVPDDAADKTAKNVGKQLTWLDKLTGGLGRTKDAIFGVGDAIAQMNELSIKGILKVFAAELKALALKATIKALEYSAVAISALIFGDFATAARAGKAATLWGVVAAAAAAGSSLLGGIAGTSTANATASASNAAGVSAQYNPNQDPTVLKQKQLAVYFQLDIRTDDGIIIKKNIKAVNGNTELTNLIGNSSEGWAFAPAP